MSEVGDTTTNVEDIGESKDTSESNEEIQTVNADAVDDLIKKETHLRVLKESQKNKQRAVSAEKERDQLRNAKLESEGKYREIAEGLQLKVDRMSKREVERELNLGVSPLALKEGCVDVNSLMKLGDTDLLTYDAENGRVSGAALFLQEAKTKHPFLFAKNSQATINPLTPDATVRKTGAKPVADMTSKEILSELKALPKQ